MKSIINRILGASEIERQLEENSRLRDKNLKLLEYCKRKANQLLVMMGTLPFRSDEINEELLFELDPIGTIAEAVAQILEHEKSLKEHLKVSNDEIQAILSSISTGILVLDSKMGVLISNKSILDMFGISEQILLGKTCREIICGNSADSTNCAFDRIMETKRAFHQADWNYNNQHFEVTGAPIKNRFGDVTHVVLAYTDITRRVETERRLREREQLYLEVFENVDDMIQCVMADGSFLFVNNSWKKNLGYSDDERAGLKIWNTIAPDHRSGCQETFKQILDGIHSADVQTVFFSKDGSEIAVAGRVSCSYAYGKPVATLGVFRRTGAQTDGVLTR